MDTEKVTLSPTEPHILVVDDDERLRTLLTQYLGEHGYFVSAAANTVEAEEMLRVFTIDGIVLDVMMPGETGMAYAARLRARNDAPPVLLLTARGEADDRIAGLEAGAADYLGKPFAPKELLLRLENIVARARQVQQAKRAVQFGEYRFDLAQGRLTRAHDSIYLTSSESDCLRILAESAGVAVSRETIAERLGDVSNARSVDVQINRLRKKIEPQPGKPVYLQTIRHAGYVLYAQPSEYMRPRSRRFAFKQFLPSNLFGRAFLIMVLPMVLSQIVIAHIFYDRHWGSVSRNMANSVVSDVVWLYDTYDKEREEHGRAAALNRTVALGLQMGIAVTYEPGAKEPQRRNKLFPELYHGLSERFTKPFAIFWDENSNQVHVRIYDGSGILDISVNGKMLTSSTTTIFLLWMIGSSLLLMMVATLFLRNQVKPIVQLAQAAEKLGLGQDVADFKPRGASEVRRAGSAFLLMSERIRRHVQNHTEMLAGISHHLRTPLTRMTLELELATMSDAARGALTGDIKEMGNMIDEYIDFARGDAGELAEPIELNLLLGDITRSYGRSKRAVHYTPTAPITLMLRPQAMRRALTNVIDNALRYGGGVAEITLEQSATFVRIKITDQGPGINDAQQEEVFKPFTRLEPSRNTQTGGTGLGLSIARTVAQSHGGDVTLENQRDMSANITGLEVTLRLPRPMQPHRQ